MRARMARETSHVHLVNNSLRSRPLEWSVALPIVRMWIDDNALHRRPTIVAFQARRLAAVVLWNNNSTPIWVQQNLSGIETYAARRVERSLDAVAIQLPRFHALYKCVPVVVRPVCRGIDRDDARGPRVVFPVKKQQLHA